MALMSKPTHDPKVTRWWWRTLRTWVYSLVDPLWEAFRGENNDDIALTNVTSINGVSSTELTVLDGLTATTAELNALAGLTATMAELNKTDRTQADGIAEASRVVVLNADKDIFGKRYDINQSLVSTVAGKPCLRFDGVDDYVAVADDADLDFGAEDFTVLALLKADDYTGQLVTKWTGTSGLQTRLSNETVSGKGFYIKLGDGTNVYQAAIDSALSGFQYGGHNWLALVFDRDATAPNILVNGIEQTGLAVINGVYTSVNDISNAAEMRIGQVAGVQYFKGAMGAVLLFNRALTDDEVRAYQSGAPLNFADMGANQTDLVTNGDDWTGATGSTPPNSWSDSGSASVTYIIRDNTGVANMDDKVLEIDVSGSGSKTLSQGVFQTGKRYRVTFAYRNLDGSGGATKVTFGSSANSATLQNTTISGDGVLFTQEVLADGADLAFEVTTAGALQVDAVQVVQIGCLLALRPEGITAVQWQDASGNELHGQVNGAVPLNLPSNHLAGYVKKGIAADTTLSAVIPAGYRIRSIIVEETAGNAITGGLKIGTSAGGTEVVNAQAIGASALVDCALGTRLFSLTAAQTLYVEDVTAWNSASIDLYLEMERIK